ncbi:MAG TPA: nucleoside phosphorylase [Candidatus Binataceae bacterium]|nr:nucleoside phosphorylase [Candidatus Binataceae bacterium]
MRARPRAQSARRRVEPAPILEHDPAPEAIIEPAKIYARVRPAEPIEHCVLCFFHDVNEDVARHYRLRTIHLGQSEMGNHPVHELEYNARRLVFAHPRIGAPMSAATLELCIALGCTKFVACGGAGVLDGSIAVGRVVVPTAAIRDEGTSYHYLPAGREVAAGARAVAAIERVLKRNRISYLKGKTWTTDALFRETRARLRRRRAEGCLTVEMEAAAFFAVAQFRGVEFGQILYGGDDLSGDVWEHRNWNKHRIRQRLFTLAVEACLLL